MKFPVLHSERLDFIEINDNHLYDLFVLFGDPNVTRFYNLLPFENPEDGQKFVDWYRMRFREGLAIRWGISLKGSDNIIGTIGFNNYTENHRANIGFDLQKNYWGKKYISEALNIILPFGFDHLSINRIEAEVMPGNIASVKALEKVGFQKEGLLRDWMYWNDKHYDMEMYSLLKKDLAKRNA